MSQFSNNNTGLAFYLPLLELKMLFDCANQVFELEPFKKLSSAQERMFEFIKETPTIDLQLNEEKEKFGINYQIILEYLNAKGIVSDDVKVANDFIKRNFTPYESLLLRESTGPGLSLYFALVSTLKFNFIHNSYSENYPTKYNKTVKGYKNLNGITLENENYYGAYIDTQEGAMLLFMQGKKKPLSVSNYDEFLELTQEIFYTQDYEYYDDELPVFYPHLELELSPPKQMVVGLEAKSKRFNQMVDFKQFNMLSKVRLDKYGMTVETGATMEVGTRGIYREKYVVEDNVFIFLMTYDTELVNAMYVEKGVFLGE